MTITDFLLARIAEDKALAEAASLEVGPESPWPSYPWGSDEGEAHLTERFRPDRVLRECEAKRQVVGTYQALYAEANRLAVPGEDPPGSPVWVARNMYAGVNLTIRVLAAVYSDHPDYDPAWTPP